MSNMIEYKEQIAFHPGYYVKELIDDQGITQEELAKRLQTTPKTVSDLVNGRINLTDEMVLRLSIVFGTSTSLWLNLNKKFIERKLVIEEQKQLDRECELARLLDYKFWVNLGVVKKTRISAEKVKELQRYLKVSSLSVLQQRDFLVQYRTSVSEVNDTNVINANAWVQTAINMGSSSNTDVFSKKKLKAALPEIRSMTVQKPDDFMPRMKKLLADCGVALVILPNLKNCGINGAVKWMGKDKVLLALNDRRKFADIFWFALFHELGHVFQQRLTMLIVSDENKDELMKDERLQKLEEEADVFSCNALIPEKEYRLFLEQTGKKFTSDAVISFAEKINILPGIVIGRLQHDRYLDQRSALNSLKRKYTITEFPNL